MILHGVNMVFKRPPYYPAAGGFNGPDARFLRRNGFDAVRVGTIYEAVQPQPGRYSSSYLAHIARTQRQLARKRIFSLLDFHQDLFAEKFQGEGFPAWSILDDGAPTQPLTGFPLTYFSSPGENAAWDSLWDDAVGPGGVGLQERYASAWKRVAKRFKRARYVMGYDPLNEPWPGSRWPTCVLPAGCPGFERGGLGSLEQKVVTAIRKVDRTHTVWYEPVVTANEGSTYQTPKPKGGKVGFNFHDYCLASLGDTLCNPLEQHTMDNALEQSRTHNVPMLLSEFGATSDPATIKRMVDRSDRAMVSWMWWHYCGCDDPTTSGPGDEQAIVRNPHKAPSGANVLWNKLALLERPYPMAVAGTPAGYSYDRDSNTFALSYSTRAPGGRRLPRAVQTTVFVPRLHYPRGYVVRVTGARVTSAPRSRYLLLQRLPGAGSVSVQVTPRGVQ